MTTPEENTGQEPVDLSKATAEPLPLPSEIAATPAPTVEGPPPEVEVDVAPPPFDGIGPGQNPAVHQEFPIDKKPKDGDIKRGTFKDLDQTKEFILFQDLRTSSMLHNLTHPNATRLDTDQDRQWAEVLQTAPTSHPPSEGLVGAAERPDAEYYQYLKTERGRVGFAAPSFQDQPGVKLTGDRAMLRVRSLLGQGGLINIPLWHSGFHLTLKTPSDSALIETRTRMQNERIQLGRYTFGLIFSNTAAYTVSTLLDLVMDHVTETSLKDQNDLRMKIETPDLPILFWGLACAIWPNGFQYARSLTTEAGIAKHEIVEGLIDVAKLMWVDNKAFTAKQKAHMSNRQVGVMTAEQVQAYKEDFPLRSGRLADLGSGISVEFAPPSVLDYIRSGQRWVEKLVSIVEGTLTSDREDIIGRNKAIIEHGNATIMRQHAHWVKKIDLGGQEVVDVENIELTLETMSESEEIRIAYLKAYREYVNDITVAIIAIPEAADNDLIMPRFPHLIPIDVVSVFFTLLMLRVNQLANR